ncbi:hypothetical protein vseg_013374 [Gypsophila vaccaria]
MVRGCEEIKGPVAGSGSDRIICPKPRRVGFFAGNLAMSFRWQRSKFVDINDAKAGAELLDLILMKKEDHGEDQFARDVASSPPSFFLRYPS